MPYESWWWLQVGISDVQPQRIVALRTRRDIMARIARALAPVLAAGIGVASSACDAIQELVPPTPTREPGGAGTPEAVASPTVTPRPAVTINPATLPGKLVFVSDANIAVWERGSMRKLTGDRISRQPTWSPDGTRIALVKLDVNSSDIWLMNADGANARQLTRNESRILNQNSWAFRPTWWPDGSRLLFLGEETTNDLMVWEIGLDGRNKKPFLIARDYDGGLDRPGVTPDGKTVVLVSYRAGGGKAQVWSTSVPNGPWKQLTEHADGAYDPCLSPDGTRIAYTVRSQSSHDIWVMNADGSGQQRVTYHGGVRGPCWSPDAQYLAYVAAEANQFDLWVATVPAALPPAPPTATPSRKPGAGTPVPTVEPTPTSLPVRDVRPVITRQVTRQAQIEAVSGVAWTQ